MSKYEIIPTDPNAIEFTLKVTMTLGEWKRLKDQMNTSEYPQHWPTCDFIGCINDMVQDAQKHWYRTSKEDDQSH